MGINEPKWIIIALQFYKWLLSMGGGGGGGGGGAL